MSLPTYPVSDYDQGQQLLAQLGSFWVRIFASNELQTNLRSNAHVDNQTYLNFLEAVACVSRFDVPVFHRENWYYLTAKKSEAASLTALYRADDLIYGDQDGSISTRPEGSTYAYGDPDQNVFLLPIPANLRNAQFQLQNLVVKPSKVWVPELDFVFETDRDALRFKQDPFLDPLVARRDIFDAQGVKIDEEVALWVYKGDFDLDYIYTHFGYVLGLKLSSTQGYKDLLNVFWDMHLLGGSVLLIGQMMSALAGAPLSVDPSETVEVIRNESDAILVVTNTRVYSFGLGATISVAVGDVIKAGTELSDAFSLRELAGANPDYSILPAVALSKNFLSGGYFAELSFKNHSVALDYQGLDADGKAIVKFETFGYPGDITDFWAFVHAQGKANNRTLANMLDLRSSPVGEPSALALPATVNPLEFVLGELMKNNLFIIKVRQASFSPEALGLSFVRLLRDVVPPHTTFIVFAELSPTEEGVDLTVVGDEDVPGSEEEVTPFAGSHPDTEDGVIATEVGLIVRQLSLTC